MNTFSWNTWSIAYERHGAGTPLLFIHNGGTSHAIWMEVIALLSDSYDCIAIDLLGYGDSSKPETGYTMDQYVALIEALLDSLAIPSAFLVGNCMGSAISVHTARQHPARVRGLLLVNPLTEATFQAGWLAAALALRQRMPGLAGPLFRRLGTIQLPRWTAPLTLAFQVGKSGRKRGVQQHAGLQNCHSSEGQLRSMLAVLDDIEAYAEVDRFVPPSGFPPIMTVWGQQNRVLSARAGESLNTTLQPVSAHTLPDCGHLLMLEKPDELAAMIRTFVDAHASDASAPHAS